MKSVTDKSLSGSFLTCKGKNARQGHIGPVVKVKKGYFFGFLTCKGKNARQGHIGPLVKVKKGDFFGFFLFCTLFNTASSAAP